MAKKRKRAKAKPSPRGLAWVTEARRRDGSAATRYAADVIRGRILAGPWVRLAAERHLRDLLDAKDRGLHFDRAAADHACGFFPQFLKLAEGRFAGRVFQLEPWQAFIVGAIFGWKDAAGARRFQTAYIEVGKGNGKTPLAAGLGLYGLLADGEASAEIYSAATAREQARILWLDARKMVAASPELAAHVRVSVNNLAEADGYGYFRPVSSEHRGLDGKRVHMALIDELHEHPNDLVVEKMRAGMKGRRQALQFEITNAGHDRTSICWQHHDYSGRLLAGTVENDHWFAYVCALDDDDQPFDSEASWIKANPNLGVSIEPEYLRGQVREAIGMPSKAAIVRRLNFCEWTRTQSHAIDLAAWGQLPAIGDRVLDGVPAYGGLDLGQSNDFSAFAILWALPGGEYAARVRYWLPAEAVDREQDRPVEAWVNDGLIAVTDGAVTDYDVIEDAVREDCLAAGVRECAFDRRFAQQLAHHLVGDGLIMVDQPQGFQLSEATIRLQEIVASGRLHIDDDPVLAWMAGNLVVRTGRYQEIRPDKDASAEKVDGIVALIMALSRAISQPEAATVYEDRGVLTV